MIDISNLSKWSDFYEFIVLVDISISATYYCFMVTRILKADIQSFQKKKLVFCAQVGCTTSVIFETELTFMLISKLIQCPFQLPIIPINSVHLCFHGFKI
jgi:hypothetical protein